MGLTRQAKTLTSAQLDALLVHVAEGRNPRRDRVIVLLSFLAGLRAKEVSGVRWRMVTDVAGVVATALRLEDRASKGRSGRVIPLHALLRAAIEDLHEAEWTGPEDFVLRFRKGSRDAIIRSAAVQGLFRTWYDALGFRGASSHSGRRTFITQAAAHLAQIRGGSLRDVQVLAGHASLELTQRYIDRDDDVHRQLVDLA